MTQNDFTEYEPCGFKEGNCPIHDVDHVAERRNALIEMGCDSEQVQNFS